jgi:N-acetylneuraminate lyase
MPIQHLQGLIAAPFTPMFKDGNINTSVIPSYYQFLKQNGVTGAFINGSTGEGVSMTTREKMSVAEAWADCTKNDADFKVMELLGGTSISDCIELAKHAESIGLYGVSLTSPFYFKPADVETLAKICIEVAQSVPAMPFIIITFLC